MNLVKQKLIKTIAGALVFAIMISTVGITTPVKAESVKEMQQEINDLKAENNAIQKEIDALDADAQNSIEARNSLLAQIDNNQKSIDTCNEAITTLDAEIATKEADIVKKTQDLQVNQEKLEERLTAIYMSNDSSQLEVLVGTDTYINYLYKDMFVQSIARKDAELLTQIETDIEDIETQKAEVQSKKDAQQNIRNDLAATQATLTQQRASVNSDIENINAQKEQNTEQLAINEQDSSEIEAQIQASIDAQNKADKESGKTPLTMPESNASGMFAWPVPGYMSVSSPFGPRNGSFHKGIDIAGGGIYGAPVVASEAGTVVAAGPSGNGYGNYVIINHGSKDGESYSTVYAHLSSVKTSVGSTVARNDVVGSVGSTGNSSGPHLHYEVRKNGTAINPQIYF